MTPADQWGDVSRIFHGALQRPPAERERYVVRACDGDAALLREVGALLSCESEARRFMGEPEAMLAAGTSVGPYEILGLLGSGGMGDVYRARDTRLKREVALKVLPRFYALDAERLARFRREAEVLATLNHPHIAAIYGLEESGPSIALVLELVPGESLADRLARGPLAFDNALSIARQVAEALDAAHEHGIVHRDLKPHNIRLTPDGLVKVLDFGLAKLIRPDPPAAADGRREDSGAIAAASSHGAADSAATAIGRLLGTPAYMSPEQAMGRPADKRTDVWAFGCVLYEMLTGKRAFRGDTIDETITLVGAGDVDWSALPSNLPPPIRALLRRCLEKDRRRRITHVAAALAITDDVLSTEDGAAAVDARESARVWRRVAAGTGLLLLAVIAGAVAAFWLWPRDAPRVTSFTVHASTDHALVSARDSRNIAVAPSGSHVAWVGQGGALIVRAMRDVETRVIARDGALMAPFFSPDGQWVGYSSGNGPLMKAPVSGGPPILLVDEGDNGLPRGATWHRDGSVIFATNNRATGLQIAGPNGTAPRVLTVPDRARGEADHVWPELLPDGRHVLFTITAPADAAQGTRMAVLDLATRTHTTVLPGGSQGKYLRTGHLVYVAEGRLYAVPFDAERFETRGTPVVVLPSLLSTPAGAADFDVADDGTLVYVAGDQLAGDQRELMWVRRDTGGREPLGAPLRGYVYARPSPDATRVLLDARDQDSDIWVWDVQRRKATNLTRHPAVDRFPLWMPGGREFLFVSDRDNGRSAIYRQAADGTGTARRLTEPSTEQQTVNAVTADGKELIFDWRGDLWILRVDSPGSPRRLTTSPAVEQRAVLSPNGRWLAYQSDESGEWQISVAAWPGLTSPTVISPGGGMQALWSADSRSLYFVTPGGELMEVQADADTGFPDGQPSPALADERIVNLNPTASATFDVAEDPARFLLIRYPQSAAPRPPPVVTVVQHWFEELTRLVPAR
jgi:serine/threonine-protein kinase